MVRSKSKNSKKITIGYTTGVFDLFHIGHVNILKGCKSICDKLIVGVSTDELVKYKFKKAVIPFDERIEIIRSCKYVDLAIPQYDLSKIETIKKIKANYLFVGDDWYLTKKWKIQYQKLKKINCNVIYFPYTKGTSSSLINKTLRKLRK